MRGFSPLWHPTYPPDGYAPSSARYRAPPPRPKPAAEDLWDFPERTRIFPRLARSASGNGGCRETNLTEVKTPSARIRTGLASASGGRAPPG